MLCSFFKSNNLTFGTVFYFHLPNLLSWVPCQNSFINTRTPLPCQKHLPKGKETRKRNCTSPKNKSISWPHSSIALLIVLEATVGLDMNGNNAQCWSNPLSYGLTVNIISLCTWQMRDTLEEGLLVYTCTFIKTFQFSNIKMLLQIEHS